MISFFVIGTQRSGTTLLTRALSGHPDVFVQNEISVEQVFKSATSISQIEKAVDQQIRSRHGKTVTELLEEQDKRCFGIKDPQLTEYLDKLAWFEADCRFIVIIRDPRAVVNSYKLNRWGLGTNAYTGALRWREEVNAQNDFIQRFPERCLKLYYEDLVNDMEPQLKAACAHLNLTYSNQMLEYHKQKAAYRTNASNINTHKKPDKAAAVKWRQQLSEREIRIIETTCAELMKTEGYRPEHEALDISFLEKAYYKCHQAILGELQIQYQLKRAWLRQHRNRRVQS